jgi:hypothetical protein
MRRTFFQLCGGLLLLTVLGCSLPPGKPVTREELMKTRVYQRFIIEESPEQVLNALNAHGEAVLNAKRNIRGKDIPVHLKLLATSEGIEIIDYDR